MELAAVAGEVFLGDETLDGGRTGGGSAEATLGHGFAKGFVVDELAGTFHGGEERGFGHPGRWLGFLREELDGFDAGGFTGVDGAKLVLSGGDTGAAAVDFEPAGFDEDAAFGFEGVQARRLCPLPGGIDAGEAGRLLELGDRIEDGDEALHDHVVELLLGLAEFGELAGRDDGKVIGDLLAVENAARLVKARAVVGAACEHGLGVFRDVEVAVADVLHRLAHVAGVILRQVPRIGPRVGDHLVLLIKRLGDLERALRGKRGFTLEGGEVVELRGNLGVRLFLLGDLAGLAGAAGDDGLGGLLVPDAFGFGKRGVLVLFPGFIDPLAEIFAGLDAEGAVDLEIGRRLEGADLGLALGEDGERRRLDATGGGDVESAVAGIETGEGAGGVEADQPIGLGAAFRGIGQRLHRLAGAEVFPSLEDGIIGHRLHPETLDRLVDAADFHDVAENQLTLAAGVAGIDDEVDVLALRQLEDLLQAGFGVRDGIQIELVGDGREDVEIPRQLLAIRSHRHAQFDQVADGGSDDGGVVLEENIAAGSIFLELAKDLGEDPAEIGHDTGFFRDDECFSHGEIGPLSGCGLRD